MRYNGFIMKEKLNDKGGDTTTMSKDTLDDLDLVEKAVNSYNKRECNDAFCVVCTERVREAEETKKAWKRIKTFVTSFGILSIKKKS